MRIRRPRAVRSAIAAVLIATFIASACPGLASASVSTPSIRRKQAEASQAQSKLADLSDAFEARVEDYNAVTEALDQTRQEIEANEADLQRASAALDAANAQLGDRADSIYRSGSPSVLELFLGTRSVPDFLARLDFMSAIGSSDADLVTAVRQARYEVQKTSDTLAARQADQIKLRAKADDRRQAVADALAQQKAYLASIRGDIARLMRAEEARQAQLAAERARQAKLAAAALAARVAAARAAPGGGSSQYAGPVLGAGGGSAAIVGIALKYLGVPYVWGGTTPAGFDCSGLAQYVYAQAGISIPRTSKEQFAAGTHVPADSLGALQPGDLVFFGTNGDPSLVHHVGIFIGKDQYVQAPATGDVVKVSSLSARISSRHDYVGGSHF